MAVENISYFDARLKHPKTYNNKSQEYTQYRPDARDFPELRNNRNELEDTIDVAQRRHFTSTPRTPTKQRAQYSQAVTTAKKPRMVTPNTQGYNREEHRRCLFPNLSRTPTTPINNSQRSKLMETETRAEEPREEAPMIMEVIKSLIDKTNLSQEIKQQVIDELEKSDEEIILTDTEHNTNSPSGITDGFFSPPGSNKGD